MSFDDDHVAVKFKTAKVYDLGPELMISGPNKEDVEEALHMLVSEDGARPIANVQQLGTSWIASCSHPLYHEEDCELDRQGKVTVIRGPSRQLVAHMLRKMTDRGATVKYPPHLENGKWVAVADEGGHDDIMRL